MSSQQTEALRALGERWRDDPPGRCDAEDNAFRRAGLELLEALAQTAGDGAREAVGRVIGPASSMSLHARLDNPLLGGTTLYAAAQGDAGTAREVTDEQMATLAKLDDIADDLDSWCKAYPTTIFPEPDPADTKWLHETRPGLCDRISASMGRHMVKHMREMEQSIRRLVGELTHPQGEHKDHGNG